jgi:hypothetical protein
MPGVLKTLKYCGTDRQLQEVSAVPLIKHAGVIWYFELHGLLTQHQFSFIIY